MMNYPLRREGVSVIIARTTSHLPVARGGRNNTATAEPIITTILRTSQGLQTTGTASNYRLREGGHIIVAGKVSTGRNASRNASIFFFYCWWVVAFLVIESGWEIVFMSGVFCCALHFFSYLFTLHFCTSKKKKKCFVRSVQPFVAK